MRLPRLRSSPSFFHPNTNRRMYRFASSGEMGEPCGMPHRLSRASVVRVFLHQNIDHGGTRAKDSNLKPERNRRSARLDARPFQLHDGRRQGPRSVAEGDRRQTRGVETRSFGITRREQRWKRKTWSCGNRSMCFAGERRSDRTSTIRIVFYLSGSIAGFRPSLRWFSIVRPETIIRWHRARTWPTETVSGPRHR